jgi:hypothetical protein
MQLKDKELREVFHHLVGCPDYRGTRDPAPVLGLIDAGYLVDAGDLRVAAQALRKADLAQLTNYRGGFNSRQVQSTDRARHSASEVIFNKIAEVIAKQAGGVEILRAELQETDGRQYAELRIDSVHVGLQKIIRGVEGVSAPHPSYAGLPGGLPSVRVANEAKA